MNPSDRDTAEGFLFTDQYQLTMSQVYYRLGMHEKLSQFDVTLIMDRTKLVIVSVPG
jgi:nicotinic acid phosphoribosyltransferase